MSSTKAQATGGPLLAEFPPVSYENWKALVEAELKGAPFDKKMFTSTYEGITLKPIYRPEDGAKVAHAASLPGFAPFVRGTRAGVYVSQPWAVSQEIVASSPEEFNKAARHGLERGLTALNIVLDKAGRNGADPDWPGASEHVGVAGLSIATLSDLDRTLAGVDLESVPLFIRSGASGLPVGALLVALAKKRGANLAKLRGCVEISPLGILAHEGALPQSLEAAYREMAAFTAWAAMNAPQLQTVCVHTRAWHEAGGNAVQELAFGLAAALEYLRELNARGVDVETAAPRMRFAFTVGSQFFMEIAKLRAARLLWARLVAALGGSEAAQRASLHVRTSLFNKTAYDPYVNMLRTTVEAFAGVLGGCDSLQVSAFDEVVRTPDEFSQRAARNQQLLLREECHLTKVIDPAGGSWFVETLTDDLARRAWALFQEIEKLGGMAKAMRAGWPQAEVAKVAAEKLKNVVRRRDSVIGTNVYANVTEKPLDVPVRDMEAFQKSRAKQVAAARTAADIPQHKAVLERLSGIVGKAEAVASTCCGASRPQIELQAKEEDGSAAETDSSTLQAASPTCCGASSPQIKLQTGGEDGSAAGPDGSTLLQANAALFEACVEAVTAGATLGEITRTVRIQDKADAPVKPVVLTRAASQFEKLRKAVEAHAAKSGQRPRIFLANMGPLKQHKARADFSRGFFEVAGFEVIVPPGAKSTDEAAAAALKSGANAVCICSTDDTYPEIVPALVKTLRAQKPDVFVILAGYPAEQIEAHKAAGVNEFIHIRANALDVLTNIAAKLGVQL
ncbi:MAG TPA: methylmalonyl-CoA mutase family protein [Verrucomicrobiae bacterium]